MLSKYWKDSPAPLNCFSILFFFDCNSLLLIRSCQLFSYNAPEVSSVYNLSRLPETSFNCFGKFNVFAWSPLCKMHAIDQSSPHVKCKFQVIVVR